MDKKSCFHCRDSGYVLTYKLEKFLEVSGYYLLDLPKEVVEQIPISEFESCHCHLLVTGTPSWHNRDCKECGGTTWRFSEQGQINGYRFKKIQDLSPFIVKSLPCEYFERCPCDKDYQPPSEARKKLSLTEIIKILKSGIRLPSFKF